jgi:hypothetical protein
MLNLTTIFARVKYSIAIFIHKVVIISFFVAPMTKINKLETVYQKNNLCLSGSKK